MKIDKSKGKRICNLCKQEINKNMICISESYTTRSICIKCFVGLFVELSKKIDMEKYMSDIFEELL